MGDQGAGAESGAEAGTGAGRLVAFRWWKITPEGHLTGVFKSRIWRLGETVKAQCLCYEYNGWGSTPQFPAHEEPPRADPAECGLYAYDRAATAQAYLDDQGSGFVRSSLILGVVLLWGRIIVGRVKDPKDRLPEPGYRLRAQFGRIVALDRDHETLERIANRERVEMVSKRYLEAWAVERYGAEWYRVEGHPHSRQEGQP